MTKRREPESIHDALFQTYGLLTLAACSKITGKSESYLRKLADPDNDGHKLPYHLALLLDCALIDAGQPPLLHMAYGAGIERHKRTREARSPQSLENACLKFQGAVGAIAEAVVAAREEHSHGGPEITPHERHEIAATIAVAERSLNKMRASLDDHHETPKNVRAVS